MSRLSAALSRGLIEAGLTQHERTTSPSNRRNPQAQTTGVGVSATARGSRGLGLGSIVLTVAP